MLLFFSPFFGVLLIMPALGEYHHHSLTIGLSWRRSGYWEGEDRQEWQTIYWRKIFERDRTKIIACILRWDVVGQMTRWQVGHALTLYLVLHVFYYYLVHPVSEQEFSTLYISFSFFIFYFLERYIWCLINTVGFYEASKRDSRIDHWRGCIHVGRTSGVFQHQTDLLYRSAWFLLMVSKSLTFAFTDVCCCILVLDCWLEFKTMSTLGKVRIFPCYGKYGCHGTSGAACWSNRFRCGNIIALALS